MRTVVINDDYLGDSDVDYSVTRAKAIIINNENKVVRKERLVTWRC